jgi:hypothetical protein
MKYYKFTIILTIFSIISCQKQTAQPIIESAVLLHNIYDFRITNNPDSAIAKINNKSAYPLNLGNRQNYVLNTGDQFTFYYSWPANKTPLGSNLKQGQNRDSLLMYYVNNVDSSSAYNFAIWRDDLLPYQSIKYYYPKQRIIINGTDTTYKFYVKSDFKIN